MVKVQAQAAAAADEAAAAVEVQLMAAARVVRSEVLQAQPGKHCDHCQFHAICPTKASGTVLS